MYICIKRTELLCMAPRVNDNIIDYLRDKGNLDKHFL